MNMDANLVFARNYDISILSELPQRSRHSTYYYPSEKRGPFGLIVEVVPDDGEPWIGVFGDGYSSSEATTGVFSMPNENQVLIVYLGRGFIIDVHSPDVWVEVESFPVNEVLPVRSGGVIVLADYTALVAYGVTGKKWKTPRLSWDGIKIEGLDSGFIRGVSWDAPNEEKVEFKVDVKTGMHEGGSAPPN